MNISEKEEAFGSIISLEGDFDLYTIEQFKHYLLEFFKVGNPIIIDLSKVSYIDSSGVGGLLFCYSTCNKSLQEIVLSNLSDPVKQVLKLSQLDKFLPIVNDLNEARSRFLKKERA